MDQWLQFIKTLNSSNVTVINGSTNPRSDISGVAGLIGPLGYSAVIIIYPSSNRLRLSARIHNTNIVSVNTGTSATYYSPDKPTDELLQPPAHCVIVRKIK